MLMIPLALEREVEPMTEYRVVWEIDINEDNPLEAAISALDTMRDLGGSATGFDVFDGNNQIRVDLEDNSCVNI